MEALKRLFNSRKALIALAGIISAVANELLGKPVSTDIVVSGLALIGLVVFGIAWEDASEKKSNKITLLGEEKEIL